jgi:WD40 repeat protein
MEVNMKARALVACGIVFLAPAVWAGESVLYSVTERSVAYPATNRPVKVSVAEDKTDVFAIDPETGKTRLVFSDANAEFMLLPGGRTQRGMVAAGGRIFSVAVDRQGWANNGGRKSVYELSTDGSGKARRVFNIESYGDLFVNPSGEKIAYFVDATAEACVIRETATGKLLRTVRIQSETISGAVSAVGWMPDGERFFFSLAVAGDDDEAYWNNPNSPIGTYVMKGDATVPTRLAPEPELHFRAPDMQAAPDLGASLIGVLPDGRYLLSDAETGPAHAGVVVDILYALDLAKKTQQMFPLQVEGNPDSYHLSRSGNRLALESTLAKHEKLPTYTATSTVSLWVLELESGKQSKLISFAIADINRDFKGPWINLIGWLQD